MKIYIVRHGQTDWNAQKRMQTVADIPLNETGIKQAEDTAKKLKNIEFDLVISSPLIRARKTAEIVTKNKYPIIIDDRVIEMNAGVLDGKKLDSFDLEEFFNYHKNVQYEKAESIKEFCKRVWEFLEDIKEKYKDKKVLIVTHNIVIRAMKAYVYGIPEDGNIRNYGVDNSKIVELDIE